MSNEWEPTEDCLIVSDPDGEMQTRTPLIALKVIAKHPMISDIRVGSFVLVEKRDVLRFDRGFIVNTSDVLAIMNENE